MNKRTPNPTALERFNVNVSEAMDRLKMIEEELKLRAKEEGAGKTNWGDVGDVSHINGKLQDIAAFLGLEEERELSDFGS